jgi:hypothetical protein
MSIENQSNETTGGRVKPELIEIPAYAGSVYELPPIWFGAGGLPHPSQLRSYLPFSRSRIMNLESIAKYFAPKSPMFSDSSRATASDNLPELMLWLHLALLVTSADLASIIPLEN